MESIGFLSSSPHILMAWSEYLYAGLTQIHYDRLRILDTSKPP